MASRRPATPEGCPTLSARGRQGWGIATCACLALAPVAAWSAGQSSGTSKSGAASKVVGHGGESQTTPQTVPVRPQHPRAAGSVANTKPEPVKQLRAPVAVEFRVWPNEVESQVYDIEAGDLIILLQEGPFSGGTGDMWLVAPGDARVCEHANRGCAIHVAAGGRYQLSVRNSGQARGSYTMFFTLPQSLPNLSNSPKPSPRR